MEDKTTPQLEQEQQKELEAYSYDNDYLKCGEIVLSTKFFHVADLIIMLKDMLKDNSIKSYLGLLKSKGKSVAYVG